MIEDLKTDYKSDILMPVQQNKRTFNIVDSENNILFENVHIEDNSQYLQVGDEYGSEIINEQNEAINALARGTGLTFDTYQDYLDARALGEVPVGSIIYILEGNQTVITADQVTYNSSNVKLALDALVSNLGSKSSASAVTGDDAFSKIATLNTAMASSYGTGESNVITAASGISISSSSAIKTNGMVRVGIVGSGAATIEANGLIPIGTIKTAYRPKNTAMVASRYNGLSAGQAAYPCTVIISTTGMIHLATGRTSGTAGNANYPWSYSGGMVFEYHL